MIGKKELPRSLTKTAMQRFGDPVIRFKDPHGLTLELIGVSRLPSTRFWKDGPIPTAQAIAGFHSATTVLNTLSDTRTLLLEGMGMVLHSREGDRYRFRMADDRSPGNFIDVFVDSNAPMGRSGGGTVHHIAFRTPSEDTQKKMEALFGGNGGLRNTGPRPEILQVEAVV